MTTIDKLTKELSSQGLKETAEIAHHSDDIESFISYMEFDISERERALEIAKTIQNENT